MVLEGRLAYCSGVRPGRVMSSLRKFVGPLYCSRSVPEQTDVLEVCLFAYDLQ